MKVLTAIDLAVPLAGALASAGLWIAGLGSTAQGALAGTVLAVASWTSIHFLGRRLMRASGSRSKPFLAMLMGGKLMAMAGLTWLAIRILGFDGIGVAVGLSSLPLGIVAAAALAGPESWGAEPGDGEGARKDA